MLICNNYFKPLHHAFNNGYIMLYYCTFFYIYRTKKNETIVLLFVFLYYYFVLILKVKHTHTHTSLDPLGVGQYFTKLPLKCVTVFHSISFIQYVGPTFFFFFWCFTNIYLGNSLIK